MKLYFSKGACSLAVRIVIHEIGIKAEYEAVDLKTKITKTGAHFLTINPKGAVPVIVTDNNEIMTENSAIQQFLADTHHANSLLPPVGDVKRYRVLEWLSYISSDIHKGFGPLFNANVPVEIKNDIFIPALKSRFDFIEKHLQQKKYLMGDTFTLPDGYLFVMLSWLPIFKIDINHWPNLSAYFNEVKKRPSVESALAEEQ